MKEKKVVIDLESVSFSYNRVNPDSMSIKSFITKGRAPLYINKKIFEHVSMAIFKGETIGVVGRNGSGKSTLLRIIAGLYPPTDGRVRTYGRVSPLMDLGAGFHPELTAITNIRLNATLLKHKSIDPLEIASWADLSNNLNDPIRTFSSGMIARLAFSIATNEMPDILLIDEVLSVGDQNFQKKSISRMEEMLGAGKTVVLVSHNLELLKSRSSRVLWLENGKIRMFSDPESVIQSYEAEVS